MSYSNSDIRGMKRVELEMLYSCLGIAMSRESVLD